MVSNPPLLASLLEATISANLSPFAQHNRERICIGDSVAREKRHRTTGMAKVCCQRGDDGKRERKGRRQGRGQCEIEKKKETPARDKTREETYLFSRAGSCPQKSDVVRRRWKDMKNVLTSSIPLKQKREKRER